MLRFVAAPPHWKSQETKKNNRFASAAVTTAIEHMNACIQYVPG